MVKKSTKLSETLAVIGIIGIVFILFAHLPYTHDGKIHQISCLSNEKQIGLAVEQYIQDNDNNTPDIAATPGCANTWRNAIYPYTQWKQIFLCPARSDNAKSPDGYPRSYAANYNGAGDGSRNDRGNGALAGPGSKPVNIKDIPVPGSLIMLCEFAGGNSPEFNIDDPIHFGPDKHLLWAGHFGGSDYLLADGHVKHLKPGETADLWHRNTSIPLSTNGDAVLAEAARRAGN